MANQDAPTLAQVLLELAEDHETVYQRLVRLRLRDDPTALRTQLTLQLQQWETDDRFVRYQDAAAFGRELDVWIAQVQCEVLPRFPSEAMALFLAFLELDRVVFERVDDDGGYVGGAFELACQLWLTAATAVGFSAAEISNRALAMLSYEATGKTTLPRTWPDTSVRIASAACGRPRSGFTKPTTIGSGTVRCSLRPLK